MSSVRKPSQDDVMEETELVCLKTGNKHLTPSGKRWPTGALYVQSILSVRTRCNSVYAYYMETIVLRFRDI